MTYDFRCRSAGDLVPFAPKQLNHHLINIHGEKYRLSDDGGPLGSAEEQEEWAGDVQCDQIQRQGNQWFCSFGVGG